MSDDVIRPARPGDLALLVRLENAVFDGDRLSPRALRHAIASPSQALMVAERAGTVVADAIVAFRKGSTSARLTSLAVDPSAARAGLGRLLLAAAEAEAARRGCDRLVLEVRADNAPAVRLYEQCGYRLFGRYEDYYEDGQAALRYGRGLA